MIGGLILAAGGASRFGGPKQLAHLDDRPLIEHALDAMLAVPSIDSVVVTLGANASEIVRGSSLKDADVVEVEDWREGIAASLRAGVARLGSSDAVVVTLADQPFVTPQVIAMILDHAEDSTAPAARATFDGKPGHPVLISSDLFGQISALQGDDGARDLLEAEGCIHVECSHLASGLDVDTASDLEQARRESRVRLEGTT